MICKSIFLVTKIRHDKFERSAIEGSKSYRQYYKLKNKVGISVDIRTVDPKTNNSCNDCKLQI